MKNFPALAYEMSPRHLRISLEMGLQQLAISHRHSLGVTELPHFHKDPFDRLLVSQSKLEDLSLITPDPIFKKYKVNVIW